MVAAHSSVCPFRPATSAWRSGIVAESAAMQRLLDQVERIAPSMLSALLLGETGTGKEVLAYALHAASGRDGPFVPINCAALPTSLAESELFGHVQGAFTGAVRHHVGLIEQANNGTLFLDEFTELDPHVQAKLLRVVEDGLVRRVGSNVEVRVHVRIVAATNRDIAVEVRERRLREDLFYRLSGVTLSIPPLRERSDDIRPLVEKFIAEAVKKTDTPMPDVPFETMVFLEDQPWRGNVRELRLSVHRAVALGSRGVLRPADFIGASTPQLLPAAATVPRSWRQTQMDSLLSTVETCGSVSAAARVMGVPKSTAYDWVRRQRAETLLS